jgi:hypothetical protein
VGHALIWRVVTDGTERRYEADRASVTRAGALILTVGEADGPHRMVIAFADGIWNECGPADLTDTDGVLGLG